MKDRQIWGLIGAMILLFVLFIPFTQVVFDVNYDYTLRTVALGGAILGIVSGVLGCFAILRKESLMGDALSHASLPGVAIAFLLFGRDLGVLLIGAGIAGWLGAYMIKLITSTTRIKQDTAMGIVLAGWFAFGIALLAYIQARSDASQAGLDSFIFGQAAAIVEKDVQLISIVGGLAFVVLALFWKEFKLITFDPEFAQANGFPANRLNLMLSTLIVVAIVLGLQLAGVILMVGMLIAPGVAARQWTNKLDQMVVLSAVFGAFAGATGAIISAIDVNVPTGPMIIVVASMVVFLSIGFAPGRGLVWQAIQGRRDRRRFATQNVLRLLYEHGLRHDDIYYATSESIIVGLRGAVAKRGIRDLQQQGLVKSVDLDRWALTEAGHKFAEQDLHNQQLWEIYRQYSDELALPVVAEDRQSNIHEALTPDAIQKLELVLAEEV